MCDVRAMQIWVIHLYQHCYLNHGRSVVKNVIRFVNYAEQVFVSDA